MAVGLQVVVRIRPRSRTELLQSDHETHSVWPEGLSTVQVSPAAGQPPNSIHFDSVLGPDAPQEEVFDGVCLPLLLLPTLAVVFVVLVFDYLAVLESSIAYLHTLCAIGTSLPAPQLQSREQRIAVVAIGRTQRFAWVAAVRIRSRSTIICQCIAMYLTMYKMYWCMILFHDGSYIRYWFIIRRVMCVYNTWGLMNPEHAVVGKPLVSSVVRGMNSTCIAYGQSGAGKTYTMLGAQALGPPGSDSANDGQTLTPREEHSQAAHGLMPRMLRYLFQVRRACATCVV